MNWLKQNYWLVAILILAAVLRLYHADFQSLWIDEVLTMENANPKLTFSQFNGRIMFWEFLPHLYFFLLRYVFMIFGESTMVARVFTGLIGVVGVWAIYLLGKKLFSKKCGLIAALLLAVNAFHIFHSQDIRPYAMLTLFTTLSFYRLVILIEKPTLRNAILHGIFTALIVHSHFFGFITIFSQYVVLLIFVIWFKQPERKTLFRNSFVSGIVTAIALLPAIKTILRASDVKAFWLAKPGPGVFSLMFEEFFANSEIITFFIYALVVFYLISVFREKIEETDANKLIENKLVFGFLILSVWFSVSLIIPILKSFLDVPMILSRYLMNILPVILLAAALGISLIANRTAKVVVVSLLLAFSIIDLTVIRNYYNTPAKSQIRELTQSIIKADTNKDQIISFWAWIFPYYLRESGIPFKEGNLHDYVAGLKSGTIEPKAFWYADTNQRVYDLNPEEEAYLLEHFTLANQLQYIDAWARYYVPKNSPPQKKQSVGLESGNVDLKIFDKVQIDGSGTMYMFRNTDSSSSLIEIGKGNYDLVIEGNSYPPEPIKGKNAHLIIRINEKEIANFDLSEKASDSKRSFPFVQTQDGPVRIQLIYDNDVLVDGKDRNVIIRSLKLLKK